MKLSKITEQGRLLYFNQRSDSISIYENNDYRWLMFDDVFQSIMLKRKPWQLVLPHQYIILLPLVFFRPTNVCEFGLGGGNLGRYLKNIAPAIQFSSIEKNKQVIECFDEFFNPEQVDFNLVNADAESALFDKRLRTADWYIYDIYQHNNEATNAQMLKSKLLAKAISDDTWLSLNLSDPTQPELVYLIQQLKPAFPDHRMVFFRVPNFLNIIVHLVPKSADFAQQMLRCSASYLSPLMLERGFAHWSAFNISA